MNRTLLGLALAFTAVLGGLTIAVIVRSGPDILSLLSLLIVALFAVGIASAIRESRQ
jgi:hypothetical protein